MRPTGTELETELRIAVQNAIADGKAHIVQVNSPGLQSRTFAFLVPSDNTTINMYNGTSPEKEVFTPEDIDRKVAAFMQDSEDTCMVVADFFRYLIGTYGDMRLMQQSNNGIVAINMHILMLAYYEFDSIKPPVH